MRWRIVLAAAALVGAGFGAGWLWPRPASPPSQPGSAPSDEVLFWRNPMDPTITSPVPAKDSMGMDYLPVYANDGASAPAGVAVSAAARQSLGVRTEPARMAVLAQHWQATGTLGWDESRIVHLHTRVPGWVRHLHAHALGERVRAGQVLATLDSNALDAAQREHLVAERGGDAALAEASRQRLRALGMSTAQIAALERSGRSSREVAVHAPADGVITELGARHGMYVTLDTELFEIAPFDRLWVDAQVPAREAHAVQVGDRAQVELAQHDGPPLTARVDYVYPQFDPATRAARVRLVVENTDGALRAGMWVRVHGQADDGAPVLTVPDDAVIATGAGERVVLALPEGRFDVREVRTGRRAGGLTEIRDGLHAGQPVVTVAQFLLDAEADVQAALAALDTGRSGDGSAAAPADPAGHAGDADHTGHTGHEGHGGHTEGDDPAVDADHSGHAGAPDHDNHNNQTDNTGHADHTPHTGHSGHAGHAGAPPAASDPAGAVLVTATVRGVDAAAGTLTLDHPAIEALGMPAMTMPFGIRTGVDLTGLRTGDEVRVWVRASPRGYEVTALERAGAAP